MMQLKNRVHKFEKQERLRVEWTCDHIALGNRRGNILTTGDLKL